MKYYLGIDIGTTSSKAVAFDAKGAVVANYSFPYDMLHPQQGYSEQDPDVILEAIIMGINKILLSFAPDLPEFISFSAAMHSVIAIGEDGRLLTSCIIWADNRADLTAQKLRNTKEGPLFYHSTGVPIHSMSPLCKLIWLRENQPEKFDKAFKFIGIKE